MNGCQKNRRYGLFYILFIISLLRYADCLGEMKKTFQVAFSSHLYGILPSKLGGRYAVMTTRLCRNDNKIVL